MQCVDMVAITPSAYHTDCRIISAQALPDKARLVSAVNFQYHLGDRSSRVRRRISPCDIAMVRGMIAKWIYRL